MSLLTNVDLNAANASNVSGQVSARFDMKQHAIGTNLVGRLIGYIELGKSTPNEQYKIKGGKNQAMIVMDMGEHGVFEKIINLGSDPRSGNMVMLNGMNFSGQYSHLAQLAEAKAPFMATVGEVFGGSIGFVKYGAPVAFNTEGMPTAIEVPASDLPVQIMIISQPSIEMFDSINNGLALIKISSAQDYKGSKGEAIFGEKLASILAEKAAKKAAKGEAPTEAPVATPAPVAAPVAPVTAPAPVADTASDLFG